MFYSQTAVCFYPVGVQDSIIPDDQINYSSLSTESLVALEQAGRLDGSPWIPLRNNLLEYLQIQFNKPYDVSSITTQGTNGVALVSQFIVKYLLADSTYGIQWSMLTDTDQTTPWVRKIELLYFYINFLIYMRYNVLLHSHLT